MNRRTLTFLAIASVCLCPASAFAQASIAGIVKDSSGGVLPGVTVEASSPALIERVRSATTDSTGQYKIVDLRPGIYEVTFTLGGFTTVKRQGIVLSGSFVANIEAEMRVGSVEETLTVTAEAPLVDVQNAKQQRVMAHDVADAIPTGRIHSDLAVLIPGINVTGGLAFTPGNQDVGGAGGDNQDGPRNRLRATQPLRSYVGVSVRRHRLRPRFPAPPCGSRRQPRRVSHRPRARAVSAARMR